MHQFIIDRAGNQVIAKQLNTFQEQINKFTMIPFDLPKRVEEAYQEHTPPGAFLTA